MSTKGCSTLFSSRPISRFGKAATHVDDDLSFLKEGGDMGGLKRKREGGESEELNVQFFGICIPCTA